MENDNTSGNPGDYLLTPAIFRSPQEAADLVVSCESLITEVTNMTPEEAHELLIQAERDLGEDIGLALRTRNVQVSEEQALLIEMRKSYGKLFVVFSQGRDERLLVQLPRLLATLPYTRLRGVELQNFMSACHIAATIPNARIMHGVAVARGILNEYGRTLSDSNYSFASLS